jgi:hypothetical protein
MAGEMNFALLNRDAPAEAALAPIKGMGAVNALAAQQLQNEAAQFEMQNALAEQEAYKRSANLGEVQQNLLQRGLGKQAVAVGKGLADTQKAQADVLKSKIEQSRFALEGVTTPEQYLQWHIANHSDPVMGSWLASRGMTPERSMQNIQTALQTPGGFDRLLTESKLGSEKTLEMLDKQRQRTQGTVPAGYRMTPEGNLEAIPGGPTTTPLAPKELQKRNADYPAATAAIKGYESKADLFIEDLKKLRDHPGLENITGVIAGRTPSITADGRAAQALYDKIVAKGGFQALQDLRAMSKTGGALGNVSNQEGKQLTQSFAAISQIQDAKDVQAAIDQAIADIEGSKTRTREAYDATYEYRNAAPTSTGGAPVTGNSPAAQALAKFRASRGQ